ncbi:hypothetical protein HRbin04_00596 [archaeon HR04]|jgi:hypothetical protein|nr:hypothetical protein HRbin04_00596 [archaeon HR04]
MGRSLDPGYYSNLFKISVTPTDIEIMVAERNRFSDLRHLRTEIKESNKHIFVYAPPEQSEQLTGKGSNLRKVSKNLYGFGRDCSWLAKKEFNLENIHICDEPRLTCYIIRQAICEEVKRLGYQPETGKGRDVYWSEPRLICDSKIKIFTGYDSRIIFLQDPIEKVLNFIFILDVKYKIKDYADTPLNYRNILENFGSSTLKEIRQIQKDLIPTGINKEVSRQRLLEDILPFVERISTITFPVSNSENISIKIDTNPTRILEGVGYEPIW